MRIIEIDLDYLDRLGIDIQEYLTLYKINENIEGRDIPFSSTDNTLQSLEQKRFIKSIDDVIYFTIKAEKLFADEVVNFEELFNLYPYQTPGDRVLRTKNKDLLGKPTRDYQTLSKKYLGMIKNVELHNNVLQWTKNMLASYKSKGSLEYLPKMETFLNQKMWEKFAEIEAVNTDKNIERL